MILYDVDVNSLMKDISINGKEVNVVVQRRVGTPRVEEENGFAYLRGWMMSRCEEEKRTRGIIVWIKF